MVTGQARKTEVLFLRTLSYSPQSLLASSTSSHLLADGKLNNIKVRPRILLLAHTGRAGTATCSLCTTLHAVAFCPPLSRVLRAALATPAPRHAARIASGYHTYTQAFCSVRQAGERKHGRIRRWGVGRLSITLSSLETHTGGLVWTLVYVKVILTLE